MPRKITYLTTGLGRGGAEIQLMLLCEKFVKAGWDVGVVSLLPPLDFEKELEQLGIPLVCLELKKSVPDPRVFWRLVRTLRSWQPDVLHCHQVHANLLGRVARIFANVPAVVCTAHNGYEGPRWREWAYRLTDPLCTLTTQVSRAGLDRYIRIGAVPPDKICYVPNGIDLDYLATSPAQRTCMRDALGVTGEFVWLAVGNLRDAKDYPVMLEAFRKVTAERPNCSLFIAGNGVLRQTLETLAREKNLRGVRFLGPRDDIPALMGAADGFLMSSAWEGMPLAILEAAASRLPIVSTRVGGIADVVHEGESGYLVEPGDALALADACLQVMNATPAHRAELGEAGRRSVEAAHGSDAVVKKWEQIYTQLFEQNRQRSLAREAA